MSLLPLRVLYLLSDIIYLVVRYVLRYRCAIIRKNLSNSFPEKSEHELRKIETGFYRYFCDYLVETIKMMTMSERQIRKRMVFTNMEEVNQILSEGQSVAFYLGHYGNWEWISSTPYWIQGDVICGQIYHPLENKYFDRLFKYVRERHHAHCIAMKETLRRITEWKQQGKTYMIGFISDQTPTWLNIHHWMTFLNQETPVLTGAERLIKATNQAVVYGDVRRVKRGYYTCEMRVLTRDSSSKEKWEITEMYFRELEKTIIREPRYWLWSHNRWKRTREEFDRDYEVIDDRVVKKQSEEKARKVV